MICRNMRSYMPMGANGTIRKVSGKDEPSPCAINQTRTPQNHEIGRACTDHWCQVEHPQAVPWPAQQSAAARAVGVCNQDDVKMQDRDVAGPVRQNLE